MRDIRSDLQERARYFDEQIRAAYAHFDRMVQQLESERDKRVADLKSALAVVEQFMRFEQDLMANVVPLPTQASPTTSLADRIKAASAGGSS